MISQNEASSLEVPFGAGLNIIYGDNKTGKSSIIKSIFIAFGCECKHIETEWKQLISSYLIFFQYGDTEYCIVREKKEFHIFRYENHVFSCLYSTSDFHEYSNALMEILDVTMPCISNTGKEFNITPPLLFRFQYIDQDDGWHKIGDSFSNARYIKDWVSNTNKYVSGYLDERYYSLRTQITQLKIRKNEITLELQHNSQFVERLNTSLQTAVNIENPEELESHLENLIKSIDRDRKIQLELSERISNVENDIFVGKHKLHLLQNNLQEIYNDIDFAMTQEEELICPTCGAHYHNRLIEQLAISSDYALNEKLLSSLIKDQKASEEILEGLKKQYIEAHERILEISKEIKNTQNLLEYSSFYRNEGKKEVYNSCVQQLEAAQKQLDFQIAQIALQEENVKKLKSAKRAKEIRKEIESYCHEMAELIDIPKTFIKLRDFVQVINKTGSETPRLVYMYQTALYNYNLNRIESPFNFLVIDTPNQQGQDEINLGNIHTSLKKFISSNGQIILGTERETGLEDHAIYVLHLKEKRKCLSKKDFKIHQELLKTLLSQARSWVLNNPHI